MEDQDKSKDQLINELQELRQQVKDLKKLKTLPEWNKGMQQMLAVIVENSPNIIIITDNNGRITYANKVAEHLSGYSISELIGKYPIDINADELAESTWQEIVACINRYEKWCGEVRQKRKDGSTYVAEFEVFPLVQSDGNLIACAGVLSDITKRRQVEKKLQLTEVSLKRITDNMLDVIYQTDKDGKIQYVSPSIKDALGYDAKDMLGKIIFKLLHPEDKKEVILYSYTSMKNRSAGKLDFRFQHVNGHYVWFESTGNLILDDNELIIGFVIVTRDITDRKLADEKLTNTIDELRRTKEVVRQRQKMSIIGQMAAGMAHEIKNPLTAVRGFGQLLERNYSHDKTLVGYAEILLDEVDRANRVIMEFLQLARPKTPVLKNHSVNDLLKEVIAIIRPQAFIKNIKIEWETNNDLPHCLLDQDQIKQVLLNMCQNALEAMTEEGIMSIGSRYLPEKNELYIKILDTGCGISPDKFEKIGVPFYTSKENGTGLGLSISYAIINAHKGRVELDSRVGEGTNFRIYLPC